MREVFIRPLVLSDASVSWKWRNVPEVWKLTGNKPDIYITEEIEREWLQQKLKENDSARFAIIFDNIYVGNIQLTNIKENQNAQFHIFIGETQYWGRGIGQKATRCLLNIAFDELKLEEVYLFVNSKNSAAIKIYEKTGFLYEHTDGDFIKMSIKK